MKKILTVIILFSSLLFSSNNTDEEKKIRAEKQLKVNMEKEQKYAREQTFYNIDNYDLKGAEVNLDSLDSLPEIEVDDFNMDSVYD